MRILLGDIFSAIRDHFKKGVDPAEQSFRRQKSIWEKKSRRWHSFFPRLIH